LALFRERCQVNIRRLLLSLDLLEVLVL
jgi:hypothetical protein